MIALTPGSFSALLDRMDQVVSGDLRYQLSERTTALVGYQYEQVDQTSHDFLFDPSAYQALGFNPATADPTARIRNSYAHYIYAGVDESFTTRLTAQARVGAEYIDFPNASTPYLGNTGVKSHYLDPYADGSMSYQYGEGSKVTLGVRHASNQTYVGLLGVGQTSTLDVAATTVYG